MASVDAVEDNKGFAEKEKADFPLLSDPTKATAKAYGVLNPNGLARRWTFYIGKDGKILGIDKEVKPQDVGRRHGREARRVRRRAGEVSTRSPTWRSARSAQLLRATTSLISNSFGHNFPVTNSRSPFAS